MSDDRPIKAHLDEEMRAEIEFALRRYQHELAAYNVRAKGERKELIDALVLVTKCLKEIMEAGT